MYKGGIIMAFSANVISYKGKDVIELPAGKYKAIIAPFLGSNVLRDIIVTGYSGKEKTYPKEIAEFAIACADSLIEGLKRK